MQSQKMSRAIVQTGSRQLEMREFPLPQIGEDDALLKVEGCGICGSDWSQYIGESEGYIRYPIVPGHEPVGIIAEIGSKAAKRWGVKEGDRVVIDPAVPCGYCRNCLHGDYNVCNGKDHIPYLGHVPVGVNDTALWGGYADYMYLDPHSLVHKISSSIPAELASLYNPLGSGISWAVQRPGTSMGDTIVILGCGQRGLCSVIAAKNIGAACIIVTGLKRDAAKLALAKEFGADHVIIADESDVVEDVRKIVPGGADVVLDTTPNYSKSVNHAVAIVRPNGTIGLAGTHGSDLVSGLKSDLIVRNNLKIIGMAAVPFRTTEIAVQLIESRRFPLEKMHTHTIPLEQTEYALQLLAGKVPGEAAIHIMIEP